MHQFIIKTIECIFVWIVNFTYTHKKKTEKFRIPVLSTATGILDDLFFPESFGKGLFFTVLSSSEEPSWLALLNRVSLIGILEFRCRVTGAEWILLSSFFSLPVNREAIVVVLTGIFTPRQTIIFQLVISLFVNFKIFFCFFLLLFWEFFLWKSLWKYRKLLRTESMYTPSKSWSEMIVFFQWLWKRISSQTALWRRVFSNARAKTFFYSTSWFRKTFWIYAEFSFRKVLVRLKSSVLIKAKRPLSYSINDTLISLSLFSFWKTTLKIA